MKNGIRKAAGSVFEEEELKKQVAAAMEGVTCARFEIERAICLLGGGPSAKFGLMGAFRDAEVLERALMRVGYLCWRENWK
jgi:hypothetical protein